MMIKRHDLWCLITVGKTTHTRHNTENVVVGGVNADLSSLGTFNSSVGQDQLKGSVIDSGEVARA